MRKKFHIFGQFLIYYQRIIAATKNQNNLKLITKGKGLTVDNPLSQIGKILSDKAMRVKTPQVKGILT